MTGIRQHTRPVSEPARVPAGGSAWLLLVALLGATFAAPTPGRVTVTILDAATNRPTPVRVHLVDARGHTAPAPDAAIGIMYGMWDHADGYVYQPDSSFYVDGAFEVDLAPGTYTLTLSKGNEYLAQEHQLVVREGATTTQTYRMERWIDMPERGWYSADGHIHLRRSPRENPFLLDWIEAEDVHVGVLLRMGDFWEIYYSQYAWGEEGVYQEDTYLLTSGQEDPRTPELGHALGLAADDRVRYRDAYYYYDRVFDRLRELGGVAGYAHQAETFHGHRGLVLDGLRGKVDILELLQFCAEGGPLIVDHYYHLLDLGFAVTAVAGSDFPWCGRDHRYGFDVPLDKAARIGNVRFYTYTGDTLSYDRWKAGLHAGHTFVSSGPVVTFTVNGRLPGDTLDVAPGTTLRVQAHAFGHAAQVPLQQLEIVGHGEVVREVTVGEAGQSPEHLVLDLEMPAEKGVWLAARTRAGPTQIAHTTPVYVRVDGQGFHNPETVTHYLDLSEQYLQELEAVLAEPSREPEYQAWLYKDGLETRIADTREVIKLLRMRLR